ncbi:acyltransferase [Oceanicella sp. SM1341]|uniref:acyltransferase n=1 Tax=Oceanicella sp. SM1341 TaxID=1548889 RepID=UPI000E51976C|nr:acyltransferase [Oceanicella sp. SM1341]
MPVTNCRIAPGARITHPELVNLYGCEIGEESRVGPFVEIQSGCRVGARCKVSSHAFLCEGVRLEDGVFIGHGVMFTNDRYPASVTPEGALKGPDDWECEPTHVGAGAAIGSNATILCGLRIGAGALVGAGAVVTRDVAPGTVVAGVPARPIGARREGDTPLSARLREVLR